MRIRAVGARAACGLGGTGVMIRVALGEGRRVERLVVHVVVGGAAGEAHDERGHGHFDVEFYDVGYGVELDVDELISEEHEADEHDLWWEAIVSG